jgi:hypothetical protein
MTPTDDWIDIDRGQIVRGAQWPVEPTGRYVPEARAVEPDPEIARLRAENITLAAKVVELEDLLARALADETGTINGLRRIIRKFEDRTAR